MSDRTSRRFAGYATVRRYEEAGGKLGRNQLSVLLALWEHTEWYPGCGWIWDNQSGTERILLSLMKKGLAVREVRQDRLGHWFSRYTPVEVPVAEEAKS